MHTPACSRVRTVLLGLLLTCWLVLAGAPAASAHTELLSTDPAEGSVLQDLPLEAAFEYSDEISPEFVDAALVAPGGAEPVPVEAVVEGAVVHVPVAGFVEPADGPWQVVVRVVSADGHPVEHTLGFELATPVAAEPSGPEGDGEAPPAEETAAEAVPSAETTTQPAPSVAAADSTEPLDEEPGNPLAELVTGTAGAVLGGLALLAAVVAVVVHLRRRP